MKKSYAKEINYTINEIGQTYHAFSSMLGISDSVSDILYVLEMEGGTCEQKKLYKSTMISRKTISSSLQKMVTEGYISIERHGRENMVSLTEAGKELLARTEAKITEAENRIYSSWSLAEQNTYYMLNQKFLKELREEYQKMKEGK